LTKAKPQYNYNPPSPLSFGNNNVATVVDYPPSIGGAAGASSIAEIHDIAPTTKAVRPPSSLVGASFISDYSNTLPIKPSGSHGYSGFIGSPGIVNIQKHVYVYVAPPEPEEFRTQHSAQVSSATKHYKIIFIKTPSPPAARVPTIPLQSQNAEKTLIYVLVRRPDDAPEISIPTAAQTQPSKPEVYFIKYKAKQQNTASVLAQAGPTNGLGMNTAITGGISSAGVGIGTQLSTSSSSVHYNIWRNRWKPGEYLRSSESKWTL